MSRSTGAALAAALLLFPAGLAAQTNFFGEDDFGFPVSSAIESRAFVFPRSGAAKAAFLAALKTDVGTETFESFAHLTPTPITLDFRGAGTATLTGSGTDVKDWSVPGGWRGNDRYPVSGDKFLDLNAGGNFVISFSEPVAGFGFFGVDLGDAGRRLILDFAGASGVTTVTVPHAVSVNNDNTGNAIFVGRVDLAHPFTAVRFRMTAGSGPDSFAFDDLTIAGVQQVSPEPSAALLLAGGLALGAAARRRAGRPAQRPR